MVTIKQQIYQLIDRYKEEFKSETGLTLVAFPDIDIDRIKLEELGRDIEEYTGHNVYRNQSRAHPVNQAKIMFAMVALCMDYSQREIAEYMAGDRTNIHHYTMRHNDLMLKDKVYKRNYNKIKSKYHEGKKEGTKNL